MANCTCIDDLLEKVKQRDLSEDKRNGYQVDRIYFEGQSILSKKLSANVLIKSSFVKKNGERSRLINKHAVIMFNYCPFCGQKYEK